MIMVCDYNHGQNKYKNCKKIFCDSHKYNADGNNSLIIHIYDLNFNHI